MTARERRGTIHLEDAGILEHRAFPSDQHVLRVHAPAAARSAVPGSFAHLTCDPSVPMRRPLSIMRADADSGWLEFLYKPVGRGLARLAERAEGETVSVLAPIGKGFSLDPARPRVFAIGGGVGIPPMVFLAQTLRNDARFHPIVLMGSEVPFPFDLVRPAQASPSEPGGATDRLRLLEEWGIESHLASNAGLAGTYRGHVTDLAREILSRDGMALESVQLAACGPEPMLRATARLAAELDLPCQIAVEEFMACGVGGCAGCTVRIQTPSGPAMRRVCVDGPVFDAREVYALAL